MLRTDGRKFDQLRKISIQPDFIPPAEGSCLISVGNTKVICTASIEERVPRWLKGQGTGWLTAEYSMLPRATTDRVQRERQKLSGRTAEIQRLIGRSLRAVFDYTKLGERTVTIDADVIQADGGTRTAAICGGYVALYLAINKLLKDKKIEASPISSPLAAVSVGIINNTPILDLCYAEDSNAQVDMNVVMTKLGGFVEIQGTAEHRPFTKAEKTSLLDLAEKGIKEIISIQEKILI